MKMFVDSWVTCKEKTANKWFYMRLAEFAFYGPAFERLKKSRYTVIIYTLPVILVCAQAV
jgi:hypothetical protein